MCQSLAYWAVEGTKILAMVSGNADQQIQIKVSTLSISFFNDTLKLPMFKNELYWNTILYCIQIKFCIVFKCNFDCLLHLHCTAPIFVWMAADWLTDINHVANLSDNVLPTIFSFTKDDSHDQAGQQDMQEFCT